MNEILNIQKLNLTTTLIISVSYFKSFKIDQISYYVCCAWGPFTKDVTDVEGVRQKVTRGDMRGEGIIKK